MNHLEREMLDLLKTGRETHGFVAIKAEFEAEGTRFDEYLRLLEIARKADLKLGLKIGGCEAMTDLFTARQVGVDYVIAPMVETSFALSKFIDSKNQVFSSDEQKDTKFYFNLETKTSFENRNSLCDTALVDNGVQGVVFGRVDYTLSAGTGRAAINTDAVTDAAVEVARLCRERELELVVGGGVASESIPALRRIADTHLTRFETRKVIFDAKTALSRDIEAGLLTAVKFEYLWLKNKREYYARLQGEDAKRIGMLEERLKSL